MKNLKIFAKIFLSHAFIGLVSVGIFFIVLYVLMGEALLKRTVDQLSSINILKKTQIENYFLYTRESLELLQQNESFLHGIVSFETSTGRLRSGDELVNKIHALEQFAGFNRLFLVDNKFRRVAGSVDTFLLASLQNTSELKSYHLTDVSNINPLQQPMLLHIMPLQYKGQSAGYVIIEDDMSKIQAILLETTGMGSTGESYLVGKDFKMRSSSRFLSQTAPLTIHVETRATRDSLTDSDKNHVITDYRGRRVLSFSRTLKGQLPWTIVSEIDFDEAMKPVVQLRSYMLFLVLGLAVVIGVITYFLSNTISGPIVALRSGIVKLSKGIIPQKASVDSKDEIGQITDAVNQLIEGLQRTTDFAYKIGSGDFNASFQALSDNDTLGQALIHMRNKLKEFNEKEIRLVREKTSAVLEAQENERKRIVLELHDGVGQLLTAVRLRVERVKDDESMREVVAMINETIAEVRRVSYNLMPNALVDFGLEAALKGLCDNIKKYASITFDFQYVKEVDIELDFDISIAVFRIVQEALNNILKHAQATHVELHIIEKNDEIYCLIRDNGKGFDETQNDKKGFGLTTMRERAKMLNGSFDLESAAAGTIIEVHIPMKR